ncbi:MAG: hypothetical protein ABH885_05860, partial [Candidatus Omnitrophota bacterium]
MKLFYFLLVLTAIVIVALLVGAFVYFEMTHHRNFYYVVEEEGRITGSVEVDRYFTSESMLYKSKEEFPYRMGLNRTGAKCVLDTGGRSLKEYERESANNGEKALYLVRGMAQGLAFLGIAKSKFSYINNLPAPADALPYDNESIMTWMPLIRNYDYRLGGRQQADAIFCGEDFMPPELAGISLTSIRDDYIDVDKRKIKAECIVLRGPAGEEAFVWSSKIGHEIIRAEIPSRKLVFRMTGQRVELAVRGYEPARDKTVVKQVNFMVNGRDVRGTLVRPINRGVYPAVILVQGEDARKEGNRGLFSDMMFFLARNGYVAMTYNLRPTGGVTRFAGVSVSEEWSTIRAAIDTLEEYRFVETGNVCVIAHSDACFIMPDYVLGDSRVKGLVLLSPRRLDPVLGISEEYMYGVPAEGGETGRIKTLRNIRDKSLEIAEESGAAYRNILGRKVFLKRVQEIIALNPLEKMKGVEIPVLVIQGKLDRWYGTSFSKSIEALVNEDDLRPRNLVYFRKLDHYLGNMVKGEYEEGHYEADPEVLESVPPPIADIILIVLAALVLSLVVHYFLKHSVAISSMLQKFKAQFAERRKKQEAARRKYNLEKAR